MRRMGGGASFCDPGFGRARNEKPPDGVPGVGFGEAGGMDGSGSGGRGHPPREIPPRGVSGLLDRPPLLGHRTGDSGVGLAPLLPTSRTRTQFVLTTRSLIGPPTRSR